MSAPIEIELLADNDPVTAASSHLELGPNGGAVILDRGAGALPTHPQMPTSGRCTVTLEAPAM